MFLLRRRTSAATRLIKAIFEMSAEIENLNPNIFQKKSKRIATPEEEDDDVVDEFDEREIFGKSYWPLTSK